MIRRFSVLGATASAVAGKNRSRNPAHPRGRAFASRAKSILIMILLGMWRSGDSKPRSPADFLAFHPPPYCCAARGVVLQRFNPTAQFSRNPKFFPRYLLPSRTGRGRSWATAINVVLKGIFQ